MTPSNDPRPSQAQLSRSDDVGVTHDLDALVIMVSMMRERLKQLNDDSRWTGGHEQLLELREQYRAYAKEVDQWDMDTERIRINPPLAEAVEE